MKRPLLIILMGLVLGEALGYQFYWIGAVIPASLSVLLFIFIRSSRKRKPFFIRGSMPAKLTGICCKTRQQVLKSVMCVALLILSIFAGLISWNLEYRRCQQVEHFLEGSQIKECQLTGKIEKRKESASGYTTFVLSDVILTYEIEKSSLIARSGVDTKEGIAGKRVEKKAAIHGRMQISGKVEEDDRTMYYPGDIISCELQINPLEAARNPGSFDQRNYSYAQGIYLSGFFDEMEVKERPKLSILRAAWLMKSRMEEGYLSYLSQEDSAMLCAMALGDKSYLSEEDKKLYEENGVAHLLAISGLHVSIVGGRVYRALRKKGRSYKSSCMGGAGILFFYGCMTGFGTSVLRAFAMYLVFLLAELTGNYYDLPSSMSLSGIMMLLEHPYRLVEGGFLISFVSVFAIGLILPMVQEEIEGRSKSTKEERERNKATKNETEGNKGGKDKTPRMNAKFWYSKGICLRIKKTLLSSAILYAITGPLILHYYYELTPYCIFLNPLVLPWMSPLMLDALVSGLLGIGLAGRGGQLERVGLPFVVLGKKTTSLYAHQMCSAIYLGIWKIVITPALLIIRAYRFLFQMVRSLPGAVILLGAPPLWAIALIYGVEILLFFCYKKGWRRPMAMIVLASVCLFLGTYHQSFRITMLDVGQGECILFQMPGGKTMLLDGGSTSKKEIYQSVLLPAFSYYGISRLDYVALTHMDEDHISGVQELLEEKYPINHLLLANQEENHLAGFTDMDNVTEVHFIEKGNLLKFGKIRFHCIHPKAEGSYGDSNDGSLVFLVEYGNFRGLFTGDLGMEQEKNLQLTDIQKDLVTKKLNPSKQLNPSKGFTLLKVAHHGSKYSTGDQLLEQIRPQYAILSAGEGNRYGHPHQEVLDRLKAHDVTIYQTLEKGAICMKIGRKRFRIRYFS